VFSTDFIVGMLVFLFILSLSVIVSRQAFLQADSFEQYSELRDAASAAASALVVSSGQPSNWEKLPSINDINSVGLAEERNVLSSEKLQRFSDLNSSNYSDLKQLLGLGKFDFFFSVELLQSSQQLYSAGMLPDSNATVVSASRLALLGSDEILVKLEVFD